MEADSNMGSYRANMSSFHHSCMVSFQSGTLNSSTGMIPTNMCSLDGNNSMAGMFMSAGCGMINHMDAATPAQCSAGSVLHEPMRRLMYVSGSPPHWSLEELEILNIGLVKYANEPRIQKYAKITATMPQKTIRDVAFRCQLMINEENCKWQMEEYYAANKMIEMKETMVGSSSTAVIHTAPMHHMDIHGHYQSVVPTLDEEIKHLLVANDGYLEEIRRNLNRGMVQENLSLLLHLRNNINVIHDRINAMTATIKKLPGSMTRMPDMPLSVNEQLLSSLIPVNGNGIYSAPGGSHLQMDPTCFRPTIGELNEAHVSFS